MEKGFLNDWIKEAGITGPMGSHKNSVWYNKEGDCLQFQSEQVAVIGDRIDEFLTVYLSAENKDIIGFQLKDVKALVQKYGLPGIVVDASVKKDQLSISVFALLLRAFGATSKTIKEEMAYSNVIRTVPKEQSIIQYSELAMA